MGLKPNASNVHRAMLSRFPQITVYVGGRPSVIPDHEQGRALDCMIPNYRSASGKALGDKAAAWARANARSLGINYVIWNQRIWNIQRDSEGVRYKSDRGCDLANQLNNLLITAIAH